MKLRQDMSGLTLNGAEIKAVLNLVFPDEVKVSVAEVAFGVSSLLDRYLVAIEGGNALLSPQLVAVIEPMLTRTASLIVVALNAQAEEYFFSGERAVRHLIMEGKNDEFYPIRTNEMPSAIAAGLKAQATRASRQPTTEGFDDLARVASVLGEKYMPKANSAAGLALRSGDDDVQRIVTLLLHDKAFTWIEGGEKARVAHVETEEDLADLIANLIDGA